MEASVAVPLHDETSLQFLPLAVLLSCHDIQFSSRLQNADDLAVLLGIIRAMTDQSLTGVGCYPLTLLEEAEQSERAVAFYRDGVIAVSLDLIPGDLICSDLCCICICSMSPLTCH